MNTTTKGYVKESAPLKILKGMWDQITVPLLSCGTFIQSTLAPWTFISLSVEVIVGRAQQGL